MLNLKGRFATAYQQLGAFLNSALTPRVVGAAILSLAGLVLLALAALVTIPVLVALFLVSPPSWIDPRTRKEAGVDFRYHFSN